MLPIAMIGIRHVPPAANTNRIIQFSALPRKGHTPTFLLQRMSPFLADFVAKVFLPWRSQFLLAVHATFV
jgi:hypothetical protein